MKLDFLLRASLSSAPSFCSRVMNLQKHGKEGSRLKRGRGEHRILQVSCICPNIEDLQEQNNPHSGIFLLRWSHGFYKYKLCLAILRPRKWKP